MFLSAFAAYRHHEPKASTGTFAEQSPVQTLGVEDMLGSVDDGTKNVSQKRQRWEARRKENLKTVTLAMKEQTKENKVSMDLAQKRQVEETNFLRLHQTLEQLSKRDNRVEMKLRKKAEKMSMTTPRHASKFAAHTGPIQQPRKLN